MMSVSALPEWKQLILDRKRREEEERERREREEEERLASMPVWKRGIIQRRRARQVEGGGERERVREREGMQQNTEWNHDPDVQNEDRQLIGQVNNELASSPEINQVSIETIGPIRQNPFIRSQNSCRRENWKRDFERENHWKDRDQESSHEWTSGVDENLKDGEREDGRIQERDYWRWRTREIRMERARDKSEGRERDGEGAVMESEKGRKEGERDGTRIPVVPGLRTIKAENIIIIEKEMKGGERQGQGERGERDGDKESLEEEKRGMRMDLREILGGGVNVTEIRASEVLIIKPSIAEGEEERNERRTSKENVTINERGRNRDAEAEKERANENVVKEKEHIDLYESSEQEECLVEKRTAGRVSQLLSKFGEHPKPPCRSKSTESFIRTGRENRASSEREREEREEPKSDARREEDVESAVLRGVPKRSFSFSERVVFVCEEIREERRVVERAHSDRRLPARGQRVDVEEWLESGESGNSRRVWVKNEKQVVLQRKREFEGVLEKERRREQDGREEGRATDKKERVNTLSDGGGGGGEGFTVASVRNPKGIAFARRVAIKQNRRDENETMMERDGERVTERQLHNINTTEREKKSQLDPKKTAESLAVRKDGGEVPVPMSEPSLSSQPVGHRQRSSSFGTSEQKVDNKTRATFQTTEHRQSPGNGGVDGNTDCCRCGKWPTQPVAPQVLGQFGWVHDSRVDIITEASKAVPQGEGESPGTEERECEDTTSSHEHHSAVQKSAEEDKTLGQNLRSPKGTNWLVGNGQRDVLIPRAVFFGVDEMPGRSSHPKEDGQIEVGDAENGLERRESWKAGRPLTRVESLRERIRQREREMQKKEGDEEESEEGGKEREKGEEKAMELRDQRSDAEGSLESETGHSQETASPQTLGAFDVTEEVSVSKPGPQLPASVPLSLSQSLSAGQEVPRFTFEVTLGGKLRYPAQGDAEQYDDSRREQVAESVRGPPGDEGQQVEEPPEEDYLPPSYSPSPPDSFSPSPQSPPFPHSLTAMSRIYNLKTVGSRTAVCISDRKSDVPPHRGKSCPDGQQFSHVSLTSIQTPGCLPDWSTRTNKTARDRQPTEAAETSTIQSVQRQVEKLQLREQEVKRSSHNDRDAQHLPQKENLEKAFQGQKKVDSMAVTEKPKSQTPTETPKPQTFTEAAKPQTPTEVNRYQSPTETSKPQTITSPRTLVGPRFQTKIPQAKTFTVNSRNSQSPENVQKILEQCNVATSPSSVTSPSLSSSVTPSPPLFSIRSASGGPGKRGATITITPRKPAAVTAVPASPSEVISPPKTTPHIPATPPSRAEEGHKKRYPTAEEIEVIGGYQNLENSCLMKNRGTPKRGRVCFAEVQLEQVCEYPSESSLLDSFPPSREDEDEDDDDGGSEEARRRRGVEGEDAAQEEDEDEEGGAFESRSAKSVGVGTGTTRVLRVDESCRR